MNIFLNSLSETIDYLKLNRVIIHELDPDDILTNIDQIANLPCNHSTNYGRQSFQLQHQHQGKNRNVCQQFNFQQKQHNHQQRSVKLTQLYRHSQIRKKTYTSHSNKRQHTPKCKKNLTSSSSVSLSKLVALKKFYHFKFSNNWIYKMLKSLKFKQYQKKLKIVDGGVVYHEKFNYSSTFNFLNSNPKQMNKYLLNSLNIISHDITTQNSSPDSYCTQKTFEASRLSHYFYSLKLFNLTRYTSQLNSHLKCVITNKKQTRRHDYLVNHHQHCQFSRFHKSRDQSRILKAFNNAKKLILHYYFQLYKILSSGERLFILDTNHLRLNYGYLLHTDLQYLYTIYTYENDGDNKHDNHFYFYHHHSDNNNKSSNNNSNVSRQNSHFLKTKSFLNLVHVQQQMLEPRVLYFGNIITSGTLQQCIKYVKIKAFKSR